MKSPFHVVAASAAILFLTAAPLAADPADAPSCDGIKALPHGEAARVLDAVQQAYAKVESLQGLFIQISHLEALDVSERSTGEVFFAKPGKMRWDYRDPEEQSFLMVDRTIWFHQPAQNQVVIDQVAQVLLSDLPVAFLLGVGDLKREFELVSGCRSPDGYVLELREKAAQRADQAKMKSFRLLVDPNTYLPAGARVVDVGDNVTALFLRNIKIDGAIGADLFDPQFPKGTDITDRRRERPQRTIDE